MFFLLQINYFLFNSEYFVDLESHYCILLFLESWGWLCRAYKLFFLVASSSPDQILALLADLEEEWHMMGIVFFESFWDILHTVNNLFFSAVNDGDLYICWVYLYLDVLELYWWVSVDDEVEHYFLIDIDGSKFRYFYSNGNLTYSLLLRVTIALGYTLAPGFFSKSL